MQKGIAGHPALLPWRPHGTTLKGYHETRANPEVRQPAGGVHVSGRPRFDSTRMGWPFHGQLEGAGTVHYGLRAGCVGLGRVGCGEPPIRRVVVPGLGAMTVVAVPGGVAVAAVVRMVVGVVESPSPQAADSATSTTANSPVSFVTEAPNPEKMLRPQHEDPRLLVWRFSDYLPREPETRSCCEDFFTAGKCWFRPCGRSILNGGGHAFTV